jgi:hypothetical protein
MDVIRNSRGPPLLAAVFLLPWRSQGRRCATLFRNVTHDERSAIPLFPPTARRTERAGIPQQQTQRRVSLASRLHIAVHGSWIGQRGIADYLAGGAVTTFLKTMRKSFRIILPLDEVKRRALCDALDRCGGNHLCAARLLGLGKTTVYRMARLYNYQRPKVQAEGLMTVSQRRLLSTECRPSADRHE